MAKKSHPGNYTTRLVANSQPSEDIFNANQALFGQLLRQKVAINSQIWSPYQPVLDVFVLAAFTRVNAIRDVKVHELSRQFHRGRQLIHDLHRVQRHVHVHEDREVVRDLVRAHETNQHVISDDGVVLDQVWILGRGHLKKKSQWIGPNFKQNQLL